ncbi:hypothetical protein SEA_BUDSKI_97 [Gordonia phage Budski]|nr:hypothetical protein SEA_BUDSKI_97 [Gordonia phage Budski]
MTVQLALSLTPPAYCLVCDRHCPPPVSCGPECQEETTQ